MSGPLNGIRVVDLTRVMAGPFCTQLLGDMGAEVIKVESPNNGDDTRGWGPFWNGVSCYYLSANRNKKSITIDLKKPEGREIVLQLVENADVFIENFRPGVIARLGLDYETLSAKNHRLVYASFSGFGQTGPHALDPAYDLLMQACSGLMSLTTPVDGTPTRAGLPVSDLSAAVYGAFAIAAALYKRAEDGRGQKVELSLLECQISWLSYYLVGYFSNQVAPRGLGSAHHSLTPYAAYKASDDYFVLAVGNDNLFQSLCQALGEPDLATDPRFVLNRDRLANRNALDSALEKIFLQYTAAELINRIRSAGVPCGPINHMDRIAQDPQVAYLEMIQNVPIPQIPELKLPGIPIHFSHTPGAIQGPPPALGEHTDSILSSLGYTEAQIDQLRSARTIK